MKNRIARNYIKNQAAKKQGTYYVLLQKHEIEKGTFRWEMEFGDFDKQVVKDELQDKRDSYIAKKNLKIVECDSNQADINETIKMLNDALHSSGELSVQL